MNKRNITLGTAMGLSVLIAGCATTPPDNAMVNEAQASYAKIKNDPDVARSGDSHMRSAKNELDRAESLLKDGKDTDRIEHAAYLANRHAQIADQQGERARLEKQVDSAEERRRKLMLDKRSGKPHGPRTKPKCCAKGWKSCRLNVPTVAWYSRLAMFSSI